MPIASPSPFLLLPRREITLAGEPAVMACTLLSLYRFEQQAGRNPAPGRAMTRTLLWSLLITFQPGLSVRDVGALEPAEYVAAVDAAASLIEPPGGAQGAQERPVDAKPLQWRETWALGRFDLGLSEDEFWHLSPGLFDALWTRFELAHERYLEGHAMVCAATTNVHIDHEKGTPVSPDFFMPGKRGEAEQKRIAAEQRAAMKAKLREGAALLGGKRK